MTVFVAGATGYLGRRLARRLLDRGHAVRALCRPGSERKLPPGCTVVVGDALDATSYRASVAPADTFVHLVGVAHPSPAKAAEFRSIDLRSLSEGVTAASNAGVRHFVYVSVAQPAPAMHAYVASRAEAEAIVRQSGLNATFVRPWYVLGPGHWWPALLLPGYWIAERLPATRETARRVGLVTLRQMLGALVRAVETPIHGLRVVEVPEIRRSA